MQANSGVFITIEGIEGVGKSTAVTYIQQRLNTSNIPLILTREPGGTPIAEAVRKVVLQMPHTELMCPETELLLIFAGRAQHIKQVIEPALDRGDWVICDRFTDASYAYQGGGRGLDFARIAVIEEWVQQGLQPNVTLLLDAPADISMQRIKARGELDRIEAEKIEFFNRARAAYLQRAQQFPERYKVIDTNCSLEEVQVRLDEVITDLLKRYGEASG